MAWSLNLTPTFKTIPSPMYKGHEFNYWRELSSKDTVWLELALLR